MDKEFAVRFGGEQKFAREFRPAFRRLPDRLALLQPIAGRGQIRGWQRDPGAAGKAETSGQPERGDSTQLCGLRAWRRPGRAPPFFETTVCGAPPGRRCQSRSASEARANVRPDGCGIEIQAFIVHGRPSEAIAFTGAKEMRGTSGQRAWILTSRKKYSSRQRSAQFASTSPASAPI